MPHTEFALFLKIKMVILVTKIATIYASSLCNLLFSLICLLLLLLLLHGR
jgi:hypothetical protein